MIVSYIQAAIRGQYEIEKKNQFLHMYYINVFHCNAFTFKFESTI